MSEATCGKQTSQTWTNQKTKPLVSYYGGKQRLAHKIIPCLPPHTVYVEPFCGGAAVMFAKGIPHHTNNHHYLEAINDTSGDLIHLYRTMQNAESAAEFMRRIEFTPYSRAEHQRALQIRRGKECPRDDIDRAWAYFVDLGMSFANKSCGGWGTTVFGCNEAATWQSKKSNLPAIFDRLKSVHVENDDALRVIERWDSPQTCYYVDPPYVGADQGHYGGYSADDLRALVSVLEKCTGSFALSSYLNEETQGIIPGHWRRFDFAANCSASGKGRVGKVRDKSKAATGQESRKRIDSLWVVDRSDGVRDEIKKYPHFAARKKEFAEFWAKQ